MRRAGTSEAVTNLPKDLLLIVNAEGAAEGKAGSGTGGTWGCKYATRIEKAVYSDVVGVDPDDLTKSFMLLGVEIWLRES